MYQVKLEQFEGPLDLLLSLIEQRELDITQVSLAHVTDQYLEYIEESNTITLEHLSDFLVVASRLLLIKSKALLPVLELTEEEEEEIEDLEYRLIEYKKFKEVAEKVRVMYQETSKRSYYRMAFAGMESFFQKKKKLPKISLDMLKEAFCYVLDEIPDPKKLKEKIIQKTISLEEKIVQIREYIVQRAQFTLSEITISQKDRLEVVVSFLAVLELVRRKAVDVHQEEPFGDIECKVKS